MNHLYGILLICALLCGCSIPQPAAPPSLSPAQPAIQVSSTEFTQTAAAPMSEPGEASAAGIFPSITPGNVEKLTELKSIPIENARMLSWQSVTNTLAVISLNRIMLLNGQDLSTLQEKVLAQDASLLDFNAETRRMALTSDRMTIEIRDLDEKTAQTISPPGGFGSASFSPDGSLIWLSSMQEFKALAYDVESAQVTAVCGGFETAAPIYTTFPSPGGKWLVWIARATIQLNWLSDCQTAAHIGHEDFIISHTFSSDESILVTSTGGTVDGEFQPLIYFWDAPSGELIHSISLKESPAMGLAFSPDDTLIVSAGSGLFVWDAQSGDELKMLAPVDQRFTGVSFSPDGQFLAAATETSIHLYAIQPE